MRIEKKPKCPLCHEALMFIYSNKYYSKEIIGYYCRDCNKVKLNSDIKLIHEPIYIGLKLVIK